MSASRHHVTCGPSRSRWAWRCRTRPGLPFDAWKRPADERTPRFPYDGLEEDLVVVELEGLLLDEVRVIPTHEDPVHNDFAQEQSLGSRQIDQVNLAAHLSSCARSREREGAADESEASVRVGPGGGEATLILSSIALDYTEDATGMMRRGEA